jgi:hypothetical protein
MPDFRWVEPIAKIKEEGPGEFLLPAFFYRPVTASGGANAVPLGPSGELRGVSHAARNISVSSSNRRIGPSSFVTLDKARAGVVSSSVAH